MSKRPVYLLLVVLLGLALVLALAVWLGAAAPARANSDAHCVNQTGTGCDASYGGRCYSSIQAAVNAAATGDEIRIASGTYASGGTVATISGKELVLRGSYNSACAAFDPDMYRTVLDGQWGGSVISVTNAGDTLFEHLTLTHGDGAGNCAGAGCGGGIYASGTNLHVSHCVITNNVGTTSGSGYGGGIYIGNFGHADIFSSRIVSNAASTSSTGSGDGGGICVVGGSVSLVENQIVDNLAKMSSSGSMPFGGGLYMASLTQGDVLTNVIRGNRGSPSSSLSSWGGGIYVNGSSAVLVSGNLIEDNYAGGGGGGGIYSDWSDAHLSGNVIVSNTSGSGGGVYVRSNTPVTLSNNLITNNTAAFGGGVYVVNSFLPPSQAVLVNNTVADNGSTGVKGWENVIITMTNNIVAGHGVGVTVTVPASATISADTNLFWNTSDPITGTNGICEDPLLTSQYYLRENSPALDAGLNVDWLTVDLDGNPRTWDEYDLGAFEGVRWEVFLPLVVRNYP